MAFCFSGCGGRKPVLSYAACFEFSPDCNISTPNWRHDAHRQHFCKKFGQYAPESCAKPCNPCESFHRTLRSLDEFSLPSLYRRGGFDAKFRCKMKECVDCPPPPRCADRCEGIPQLPRSCRMNPKPFGNVVCGLCVNSNELKNRSETCKVQEAGDDACEEQEPQEPPFVVYPLWTEGDCGKKELKVKRSGVAKCIHPSSFRMLDTVSKLEYLDFFKTKSPQDLALYQSKLAVDNRRPRACLPGKDDAEDLPLDLSRPIFINAKMVNWKQRGKQQPGDSTVSVCIPGPITIG